MEIIELPALLIVGKKEKLQQIIQNHVIRMLIV
jgi:hypothetical protein